MLLKYLQKKTPHGVVSELPELTKRSIVLNSHCLTGAWRLDSPPPGVMGGGCSKGGPPPWPTSQPWTVPRLSAPSGSQTLGDSSQLLLGANQGAESWRRTDRRVVPKPRGRASNLHRGWASDLRTRSLLARSPRTAPSRPPQFPGMGLPRPAGLDLHGLLPGGAGLASSCPGRPPDFRAVRVPRPRRALCTRNRFRGGGFLAADPARTVTRRPRRKCGRRIPSRIPSRARGSGLAGAAGSRDGEPTVRKLAAAGLRAERVLPGAVGAAARAADRRRQGESRPARLLTGAPPLPLAWLKLGLTTCSPLSGLPIRPPDAPASQPEQVLPRAS